MSQQRDRVIKVVPDEATTAETASTKESNSDAMKVAVEELIESTASTKFFPGIAAITAAANALEKSNEKSATNQSANQSTNSSSEPISEGSRFNKNGILAASKALASELAGQEVKSTTAQPNDSIFATIEEALAEIRAGRFVLVADDEGRENEGDLICAAELITPEMINFMVTEARGWVCLAMTKEKADYLNLPLMVKQNTESQQTAFTITIDADTRFGVTTGISAHDRATTIRVVADASCVASDLRRPGHISPLIAKAGGVLQRAGHTEAAVDLARLAGLTPCGVICEVMNADGTMSRVPELGAFAKKHGLKVINIAQLISYRLTRERFVVREAIATMPSAYGAFTVYAYRNTIDNAEHLAFVKGDVAGQENVLMRVHSECLTGDVFASLRCDCGPQLEAAMAMIAKEELGVLVYLRQEGRGIGLLNKIKAYALQDQGKDTVQANEMLGFRPDLRDYGVGAQILCDLGLSSVRIITNNPRKIIGLEGYGLTVTDRVSLPPMCNSHNHSYLVTKKEKMGHWLEGLDGLDQMH